MRLPVMTCPVCGKKFVRMRRVPLADGKYYLTWNLRVKYCSEKCLQRAYRMRKRKRDLLRSTFPLV